MEQHILSKLEVARLVALQRLGLLSESEEQRLSAWIERCEENRKLYDNLYRSSFDTLPTAPSPQVGWSAFEKRYILGKSRRGKLQRTLLKVAASAAVIACFLTSGYYYFFNSSQDGIITPYPSTAVELVLNNGNKIVLDDQHATSALKNKARLDSRKQEIDYTSISNESIPIEEVVHTIIVPKYGEYTVRLSDNTLVKLNSESKLTYPVQFKGNERKIKLEGEAYFEVAQDSLHRFIVDAGGVFISVLGTTFNVNTRQAESHIATTLISGKVNVNNGSMTRIISPGEQAVASPKDSPIDIREVDTDVVTAWTRDMFYFDEEPLGEIMQDLSRWYEFNVIFEREDLKQRKFTIETSRYENIDTVLRLIEETQVVKCRKEGKNIYIK